MSSAISSISSSALQQLQFQQAQRTADQARLTAETLKAAADRAERDAQRAQDNARTLRTDANQAQVAAQQADFGLAATRSANTTRAQLSARYDDVAQAQQARLTADVSTVTTTTAAASTGTSTSSPSTAAPVTNTQGQITGQIVNVSA